MFLIVRRVDVEDDDHLGVFLVGLWDSLKGIDTSKFSDMHKNSYMQAYKNMNATYLNAEESDSDYNNDDWIEYSVVKLNVNEVSNVLINVRDFGNLGSIPTWPAALFSGNFRDLMKFLKLTDAGDIKEVERAAICIGCNNKYLCKRCKKSMNDCPVCEDCECDE